jgi:hypothetical protein
MGAKTLKKITHNKPLYSALIIALSFIIILSSFVTIYFKSKFTDRCVCLKSTDIFGNT